MSKRQAAGRKGGLSTVRKHGREYMRWIGRRGASVTWSKYSMKPIGQSGYAMVNKETGVIKAVISFQIGE